MKLVLPNYMPGSLVLNAKEINVELKRPGRNDSDVIGKFPSVSML